MENYLTFTVSQHSFQVFEVCRAATKVCDLIHGNCLGHMETFFGNPRAVIGSSQTFYQGLLHSRNQSATGGKPPCETGQGDLLSKVKNKLVAQVHCRVLQEDHQP